MSRLPFLKPNHNVAFPKTDFRQILEHLFREYILPEKTSRYWFNEAEAPLYVAERESLEGAEHSPLSKYHYEEQFDHDFWSNFQRKFLYLIGEYGAGKSTFIDYYLRCYCYRQSELKKRDYKAKLILHLDLRNIMSQEAFMESFYRQIREQIQQAFDRFHQNIETVNGFSFWKGLVDIEDPEIAAVLDEHQRNESHFRYQIYIQKTGEISSEQWVELALKLINSGKTQFQWIVICLDNLDQSEIPVQTFAVNFIKRFVERHGSKNFWRIVIPLWPQTYQSLCTQQSGPLPPGPQFRLGRIDTTELMKRRLMLLEKSSSEKSSAQRRSDKKAANYYQEFNLDAHEIINVYLRGLAGTSLRIQTELVAQMISNRGLYLTYERGGKLFSEVKIYPTISALIAGEFTSHNPNVSSLLNVFCIDHDWLSERGMIAGLLMLHSIKNGNHLAFDDLFKRFISLGYSDTDFDSICEQFQRYGLLKRSKSKKSVLLPVERVVNTYYKLLLKEPAYIDQMSIATPLPEQSRKKMKEAPFHMPDKAADRVFNSLIFLNDLYECEQMFCLESRCSLMVRSEFPGSLEEAKIPRFSKMLANNYLSNVEHMKDRLPDILKSWESIKTHKATERIMNSSQMLRAIS